MREGILLFLIFLISSAVPTFSFDQDSLLTDKVLKFRCKNDTVIQTLEITRITPVKMTFKLKMKNTLRNIEDEIEGTASSTRSLDELERIYDECGPDYFAILYLQVKGGWLGFNISIYLDRAQIDFVSYGLKRKYPYTLVEYIGTFRRIE